MERHPLPQNWDQLCNTFSRCKIWQIIDDGAQSANAFFIPMITLVAVMELSILMDPPFR